jgi:hypothetical protein
VEDPNRADGHVHHGHEAVQQSWKRWLENWDEYGIEAERFIDCGEDVLVVSREHGRGVTSGAGQFGPSLGATHRPGSGAGPAARGPWHDRYERGLHQRMLLTACEASANLTELSGEEMLLSVSVTWNGNRECHEKFLCLWYPVAEVYPADECPRPYTESSLGQWFGEQHDPRTETGKAIAHRHRYEGPLIVCIYAETNTGLEFVGKFGPFDPQPPPSPPAPPLEMLPGISPSPGPVSTPIAMAPAPASPTSSTPKCGSGYTPARIGGHAVCLHAGQSCTLRRRHEYARYHFACVRKGHSLELVHRRSTH